MTIGRRALCDDCQKLLWRMLNRAAYRAKKTGMSTKEANKNTYREFWKMFRGTPRESKAESENSSATGTRPAR